MDLRETISKLEEIKPIISSSLEHADQIIHDMRTNNGFLGWSANWVEKLEAYNIEWRSLYKNANYIPALTIKTYGEILELDNEDYSQVPKIFISEWPTIVKELNSLNRKSFRKYQKEFEKSSSRKKKEITNYMFRLLTIYCAANFDLVSRMFHGLSMSTLVNEALDGNDNSLFIAVKIDRSILQFPYVQKRIQRAQFTNESTFLKKLGSSTAEGHAITMKVSSKD